MHSEFSIDGLIFPPTFSGVLRAVSLPLLTIVLTRCRLYAELSIFPLSTVSRYERSGRSGAYSMYMRTQLRRHVHRMHWLGANANIEVNALAVLHR